jgi:hypothetical protein
MLALDESSGHQDLCGSGCRSVIPYVHGRMVVVLFKHWLFLSVTFSSLEEFKRTCLVLASARAFYSSRLGSYNEDVGFFVNLNPGIKSRVSGVLLHLLVFTIVIYLLVEHILFRSSLLVLSLVASILLVIILVAL